MILRNCFISLILIISLSCSRNIEEQDDLFNIEQEVVYSEVEQQGFKRVPIDVNILFYEKYEQNKIISLEANSDTREIYLKRWKLPLEGSSLSELKCKEALNPYNLTWITPFSYADSSLAIFCVKNQHNRVFLCINVVDNDSSWLEVEYRFPLR
jgi:hypothetical protein